MLTLADHFAFIEAECAAARDAPLSRRRALLCAALIDVFADRLFAASGGGTSAVLGAEDILAFRSALARACPALGLIAALCAGGPAAPRLELATVAVPIADYPALGVEDFMVSLYNHNTVQRVVLALPDGTTRLAHAVLAEALGWWRAHRAATAS